MENQIQLRTGALCTPLNNKEVSIAGQVCQISQLTPFPLSDPQIEDWSKSINELFPDLVLDDLKQVIRDFKMCDRVYNTREGIQNITRELKQVVLERNRVSMDDFYPGI